MNYSALTPDELEGFVLSGDTQAAVYLTDNLPWFVDAVRAESAG